MHERRIRAAQATPRGADLFDRTADHVIAKESREKQERLVDEDVAPIGIQIHHRFRVFVGEHAKLLFARRERLFVCFRS
jgi:hypothetical protein